MLLYYLLSLSFGVSGGYSTPAAGFNDIHSGMIFNVYLDRTMAFTDMAFGLRLATHSGDHPGYTFNAYGFQCRLAKYRWVFSPLVECGVDYVTRTMIHSKESGFVLGYSIGGMLNLKANKLRISPLVYYEGLTDFTAQGAFLGIKMEVGYAF